MEPPTDHPCKQAPRPRASPPSPRRAGEGQEGEQDRRRPKQAKLAGYRGEDEVRLDLGDGLGEASPQPCTEQPAVRDVEDALEDLEPCPIRVPPRVKPALHPQL